MNATTTPARAATAARKPSKTVTAAKANATEDPATYTRPVQTFTPVIGKTAEERLNILRATLHTADHKLEAAYDAAESGSAVDVLLDLIAHDLLCAVFSPVMRNGDEAEIPVTKGSIECAHQALFPVLAALEGAMALSVGSVLSATLAEAFNLLDWAQDECDSTALGALMPDAPEETLTTDKPQEDWVTLDQIDGELNNAEVLVDLVFETCQFVYSDAEQSETAQSRIIILTRAIEGYLQTARKELLVCIGEAQDRARDHA